MRVLIAPNAFKECLGALQVCEAIAAGIRREDPSVEIELAPVADGGDGFLDAMLACAGGERRRLEVADPLMRPVWAEYGVLPGGDAVVELAQASGLRLLKSRERNPLVATTYGAGELVRDALGRGARRVVIGIGGSATSDGAAGMLQALGFRLLDEAGDDLPPGGGALLRLHEMRAPRGLEARPETRFLASSGRLQGRLVEEGGSPQSLQRRGRNHRVPPNSKCSRSSAMEPKWGFSAELLEGVDFVVACDVTNPLLGPNGAAAVYGPQKGATPEMVSRLEEALTNFAAVLQRDFGRDVAALPGSGAAGGCGAGLKGALGARLVPGFEVVAQMCRLEERIAGSDLVVTGEGRIDGQSAAGKATGEVARLASRHSRTVVAVCGEKGRDFDAVLALGVHEIIPLCVDPAAREECMRSAASLLTEAGGEIIRRYGRRRQ